MTAKAREVLADCQKALELLTTARTLQEKKLYWVLCVTLLRVVGHVLHKVDGKDSLIREVSADHKKNRWDRNEVFKGFIEEERNNVLKTYEFKPKIETEEFYIVTGKGMRIALGNGECLTATMSFFIQDDNGEYLDPSLLVKKALDWWSFELDYVDKTYEMRRLKSQHDDLCGF